MRCLYSPLVSSKKPAFQQRNDSIGQRQKVLSYGRILADHLMSISEPIQAAIPGPVIGANYTARHHHFLHCFAQALSRGIGDATQTNAANSVSILLGCDEHQDLASGPPAPLTRLASANIGFINFHGATEAIPAGADHGATQLMQPGPRGTIASQSQYTLKPQGTNPRLLIGYVPHRLKPKLQRFSGILKNGPCCYRGLKITSGAPIQTPVHGPKPLVTTSRTPKTFGPSHPEKIIDAGLLRSKFFFKSLHGPGIFLHAGEYYILWPRESSA